MQNAEVTRQMTVARAAQDEVEAVRKEMQEKVKAAQEAADRQVRTSENWFGHHCQTCTESWPRASSSVVSLQMVCRVW